MQYLILASGGWILDIVFFVLLVGGIALGAYKGFIRSICKFAGTLFAIIFAILFCVSFATFLENLFGMTSAIANGLTNAFSGKEGYDIGLASSVPGAEITVALNEIGIGKLTQFIIGLAFKNVEIIPAGTTTAMLISSALAKWISIVIAFVLLIVIIKLGVLLIGKGLKCVVDRVAPMRILDQTLGGVFGLLEAVFAIFLLLMICNLIPIAALHEFISSSAVVGAIFNSEWFQSATSYAISGQWFSEYLAGWLF